MNTNASSIPQLLTITKAAKLLGVSRCTFWRFRVRRGIRLLPGRKVALDDLMRSINAELGITSQHEPVNARSAGL